MRASLWLSSSSDSSWDELGSEKPGCENHAAPRIITGPRSISPARGGSTALRMAASFMQRPGEGNDNKLTRAKVERKGWVGPGISHRIARILGSRWLPRSKGFGRNGTRLALLGPIAPGCFAQSPANERGSCWASGGRRSEGHRGRGPLRAPTPARSPYRLHCLTDMSETY
jgi:hypothetical protein